MKKENIDYQSSKSEVVRSLEQGLKELKEGEIIEYKKGCLKY